MSIPIKRESGPFAGWPHERCCKCRACTPFWTALADRKPGEQVAICQACAEKHEPNEIPTKQAWFESERAIERARKVGGGQ